MPELLDTLQQQLAALPETRRWVVALSGGLDSSLLLFLLQRLAPSQPVVALHIDHQLQADSVLWAEHCRQQCERLSIPFNLMRVSPGSASEASARKARYSAFVSFLQRGDCLLLAQHGDDQAETLLLRLLRGSGVAGLAAMPLSRPLGQGMLLRPLLQQPRDRLERAALEAGLEPVEDPSNASPRYDRNFLRLTVLPALKQRWPGLLSRWSETAALMSEASELLTERAQEDMTQCEKRGGISLAHLKVLSLARQRNLLHVWVSEQSGHRLGRAQLLQLEKDLLHARSDAQPVFRLPDHQLRRHQGVLYLLPDPLPLIEEGERNLVVGESIQLPLGCLQWQPARRGLQVGQPLTLQFRQGGERLRPAGRGGSVSLKQLLQEAGLPPWLRSCQPLLVSEGEIIAVPGITLCEAASSEGGLLPIWSGFGLS
ncbi:tRNA lysidine(34) synthetase TilS [Marinobacterium sp. MBR-109]|uniref:tRNA lysidine(34) synthetase TilS n=1 Tax=Marinobacterium sp. MBR-109 TaxID=3156462 RepID=UPI00339534F3